MTPLDSPGPKIRGRCKQRASFMGTELDRFEVAIGRNANLSWGIKKVNFKKIN